MADENDDRPYTTYKARPRFLQGRDDDRLDPRGGDRPDYEVHGRRRRLDPRGWLRRGRRGAPGAPGAGRRLSVGRIVKYLALAAVAWVLISAILFLVSSQIQESKISTAAERQLSGGGYTLTTPNTVLVLGSDARPKGSKEAGANFIGSPSRSDSIMLMRVGGGKNSTLSIPRDTVVDIPGHGRNKINAAYAIGGPSLAIKTVESYLGIKVNHLVEVNFENFPQLIDSLGGITYKGGCVVSEINGGTRNGGYTLRLKAGEHEIDGKQALALARTRKNACAKREDDRTRARRQQKILGAIKDKVISFETFVRLPWVSWAAPRAVQSDMAGPSLLGLVGAELIGGSQKARVLKPSGGITLPDGGAGLVVDEAEKQNAVRNFLKG
jgi:LCP family protein required for cell wall assembly